jgi:TRAP-type C4-dicarboxylate transport system substrate-binding protein
MKYVLPTIMLVIAAQAGHAAAQVRMDIVNEYPSTSIHAQTVDHFIAELGGMASVTAHHGAALGYRSVDHYDAVGDGAVELASSFTGAWSGINPIFLVSSLPFIATTIEETRALYEATRPYYEDALEGDNQVFLLATPWPPSGVWSNQAIDTPGALSELTIRTFDSPSTTTFGNAGASPVQLSWSDVVPQLTTRGINSVLTSADGGSSAQFWEYLSDFTEVNYALPLQVMHMHRDAFEQLNDEEKDILLQAAASAEDFGWSLLETRVQESYDEMQNHGVTVTTDISDELSEHLREAAEPVVAEWVALVGDDAEALLADFNTRISE